jgi:regulator of replication initiation timing
MTISNTLADQIGQLDAQIKVLTKELEALKAQAKSSGLEQIEGRVFVVTISKDIKATLETAKVRAEMGQKWYDDHCKLAEVSTLRVKVRDEAAATAN